MLYLIIVVGIILISYLGYKNWRGQRGEKYLTDRVRHQENVIKELSDSVNLGIRIHRENITAMEQGMTEQEENYEMQFLTFQEKIAELEGHLHQRDTDLSELEARLEMHDRECLPILHETRWQALSGSVENA